jgi:hypothetical protein
LLQVKAADVNEVVQAADAVKNRYKSGTMLSVTLTVSNVGNAAVRKTLFGEPFYTENDQVTKTGSGETYCRGKVETQRRFLQADHAVLLFAAPPKGGTGGTQLRGLVGAENAAFAPFVKHFKQSFYQAPDKHGKS